MNPVDFLKRHKIKLVSLVFLVIFFTLYFANSIFVYIYPGQRGILFQSLSSKALPDTIYDEGLYSIAPWNKMIIYDVTKQKYSVDVQALTNNGLRVTLRVAAVFHPDPKQLKELTTHVGQDYVEKIILPVLHSAVRKVIGNYIPEDLYTTAKNVLQDKMFEEVQGELAHLPVIMENMVIEDLKLPDAINKAIENKLKHQQDALAYKYILEQEVSEASRRLIEAKSIKLYQAEVGSNLNDEILRWLEIKALADLSKSPNCKVIVMGNGGSGSPLVLPMDLTKEEKKAAVEIQLPKDKAAKTKSTD